MNFINAAAKSMISNVIQVLIGCILSMLVYCFASIKRSEKASSNCADNVKITAAALCGILFPVGPFGAVPIAAALAGIKSKLYYILSFMFSNAFFNLLTPSTSVGFTWKRGFIRVIVAFLAGIIIGFITKTLKVKKEVVLKNEILESAENKWTGFSSIKTVIINNFNIVGIYLLLGVLINTAFELYVKTDLIFSFYKYPALKFIPMLFSNYNVVNPFFLTTMNIAEMLLTLTVSAAVLSISRLKGFLLFLGYYVLLAALLGLSAFI